MGIIPCPRLQSIVPFHHVFPHWIWMIILLHVSAFSVPKVVEFFHFVFTLAFSDVASLHSFFDKFGGLVGNRSPELLGFEEEAAIL